MSKDKKKVYVPSLTQGTKVYEAVQTQTGKNRFLCYDLTKGFSIVDQVKDLYEVFLPVHNIPYSPYIISTELFEILNKPNFRLNYKQLYRLVYGEFDVFEDLESKYKHLQTTYVLMTYLQHKINSLPYLFHIGPPDSGKSVPLFIMKGVAYRPIFGENISEANVFNYIGTREEGQCTILEDEFDPDPKQEKNKLSLYRVGYKKGVTIPKILDGSSATRVQKYYKCFCAKVFSFYYMPKKDRALQSRCIPIPLIEGHPQKDEIEDADRTRWAKIKVPLLIWRMTNYSKPLSKFELAIRNRPKELWKGLVCTSIGTPAEEIVKRMAINYQEKRFKKLHDSLESFVVRTIMVSAADKMWNEVRFATIWHDLLLALEVKDVKAHIRIITHIPLLGFEVSKRRIGSILGSVLYGARFTRSGMGRTWRFDEEKIKKLAKRYRITEKDLKNTKSLINDQNDINEKKEKTNNNEGLEDMFVE